MFRWIFIVASCWSLAVQAEQQDLPLETMDRETFERTGLSNLSPEQLAALEAWIIDYASSTADGAVQVSRQEVAVVESQPAQAPEVVEATQVTQVDDEPETQIFIRADRLEKDQKRKANRTPDLVRSRIKGEFTGWRAGKTRFVLENGDVWQQRQTSTYVTSLDSPEVIIRKKFFGYAMEIPAINKTVLVKKVN